MFFYTDLIHLTFNKEIEQEEIDVTNANKATSHLIQ